MSDLIGTEIGNCRIEALIGSGGMGAVYRARHIQLDRPQAVKIMHPSLSSEMGFQRRFRQEARLAGELDHEHIVKIYDSGEQDGRFYMAMELLPDGSLRTLLDRRAYQPGALSLLQGLDLIRQAASGMAYAHSRTIVHRDIKPDNLLLLRQPTRRGLDYIVKVADFGLARMVTSSMGLTSTGATVGTPAYMSPEQCQGKPLDDRSDVYALAVALYEVATGYLPFVAGNDAEVIRKHVYDAPTPPLQLVPHLPQELDALILRCLAKSPAQRPSADELALELADLIATMLVAQGDLVPYIQLLDAQRRSLRRVELTDSGMVAGRRRGSDLPLDSEEAGRNHLRIEWNGQRALVIDLGSRSGTRLGGKPLPPHTPQPWPWGRSLEVGPFALNIELDEPPKPRLAVELASGQQRFEITPGLPVRIAVSLTNNGDQADTLELAVAGVPQSWLRLPERPIDLAPGARSTATFQIDVPPLPESSPVEQSATLLVRSRLMPSETLEVPLSWLVLPFVAGALDLEPKLVRGRERVEFRVNLLNLGNSPARYQVSATTQPGLSWSLSQHEVDVAPGESTRLALTVSGGRRLSGLTRRSPVTVQAEAPDGQVLSVSGQFIQGALAPAWAVLLGALLALVIILWGFGVL